MSRETTGRDAANREGRDALSDDEPADRAS